MKTEKLKNAAVEYLNKVSPPPKGMEWQHDGVEFKGPSGHRTGGHGDKRNAHVLTKMYHKFKLVEKESNDKS